MCTYFGYIDTLVHDVHVDVPLTCGFGLKCAWFNQGQLPHGPQAHGCRAG